MGYDYIFDNLYILSNPPQFQQTIDADLSANTPNFLANGGISPIPQAGLTDPATARAATASHIPDQEFPYALTWTGSIQRQLGDDYSLEVRYLGTRGVHLLTQNRVNIQNKIGPGFSLPTSSVHQRRLRLTQRRWISLTFKRFRTSFQPMKQRASMSNL